MPSASVIHAASFAVGAVVGAGTVALASLQKRQPAAPAAAGPSSMTKPIAPKAPIQAPVMQMGQHGNLDLTASPGAGMILKYGHPGEISMSSAGSIIRLMVFMRKDLCRISSYGKHMSLLMTGV